MKVKQSYAGGGTSILVLQRGMFSPILFNAFPGVPEAEVTWLRNRIKLPPAYHLHDGSLLIVNVTLSDQGLYSCRAANLRGEVTESTQLLILDPPQTLLQLEDLTTMLLITGPDIPSVLTSPSGTRMVLNPGSSVLIGCPVDGHPTPNITWFYAGQPISMSHNILVAGQILQLLNISDGYQGEFSCLAQNEAGSLLQKTSLTIRAQTDFLYLWCALEGQSMDSVYSYMWELRLPVQASGMRACPHQQTRARALLFLEAQTCELATLQHHPLRKQYVPVGERSHL
uniref:Ig-like domain-containing protein n=1 Tax=Gopherus evgoodei TaxID=1825980 RepID=A0A8C4YSS5_9SAUR